MDIVVRGRRCEVPERFRRHVADKLARLERFEPRVIRVDVEVSQEPNPRLADRAEKVELTVHAKGPVIRAEAAANDRYAALDIATDRLEARLRRVADRRRVHHGSRTPVSMRRGDGQPVPDGTPQQVTSAPERRTVAGVEVEGDGPLVVREKTHHAAPMGLDQALYEMELVGHDFYLFVDADTQRPSVVYRRRGYDYGVIRLEP